MCYFVEIENSLNVGIFVYVIVFSV
jgi:hypothetical protein